MIPEFFVGSRNIGKTHWILEKLNDTPMGVVLCKNMSRMQLMMRTWKENELRYPNIRDDQFTTVHLVDKGSFTGRRVVLFLDDLGETLMSLLPGKAADCVVFGGVTFCVDDPFRTVPKTYIKFDGGTLRSAGVVIFDEFAKAPAPSKFLVVEEFKVIEGGTECSIVDSFDSEEAAIELRDTLCGLKPDRTYKIAEPK